MPCCALLLKIRIQRSVESVSLALSLDLEEALATKATHRQSTRHSQPTRQTYNQQPLKHWTNWSVRQPTNSSAFEQALQFDLTEHLRLATDDQRFCFGAGRAT